MQLLYGRTATLTVENTVFNVRLSFSVEKEMVNSDGTGGKATIKAYNLSKVSRNSVETETAKNKKIFLAAGYGGQNKLLYAGTIYYAHSERSGPDIITTFETMPASIARGQAFLKISGVIDDYGIYQRCIQALAPFGIVQGHLSAAVKAELQSGTYQKGFADSGTVSKFMGMVAQRHGFSWNVSNNALNVFAKGEFEDEQEVLLNSETGMVGFPAKVAPGNYSVKSLLNSELEPGKRIKIESDQLHLPGDLKVIKSTHTGDTLEGDWFTEIEATLLGFVPDLSGLG